MAVCWCAYPFLRSRRVLVPPLRRVTLEKSPKVTKVYGTTTWVTQKCIHIGNTLSEI